MFNVPEDEINNWDKLMLDVISKIKEVEKGHNYYLLGVDELSDSLLEHEFAHAMYFTLPEYKTAMDNLTAQCDEVVRDSMFKCITEYGYADHVLPDEIQAYMATGLGKKMVEMNIPNIDEWIAKYREVFESFYSKTLYSSPEKIDLKWS
jgi:hypothetical protein